VVSNRVFPKPRPRLPAAAPPGQTERTCGYLLLVEHRHHLAVFKSGLELTSSFKAKHLERVPHERVEAAMLRSFVAQAVYVMVLQIVVVRAFWHGIEAALFRLS
jgi:hypothetical protein